MKRMARKGAGKAKVPKVQTSESFVNDAKPSFTVTRNINVVEPDSLNLNQRKCYDIVSKHVENPTYQLKLIIYGPGGSRKSYTLNAIRTMLERKRKKFRVMSFTGVASFLINGSTIHRTMALPYFYRYSSPRNNLKAAQKSLGSSDYFIIDELNMIGLYMLGYLNERLKAVFENDDDFGGKHCILTGDFGQVRPVADVPLFRNPEGLSGFELKGAKFYQTFDKCVFLDEPMRQIGSTENPFRELLSRFKEGRVTKGDEEMLNSRQVRKLSMEEKILFLNDANYLFGENAAAEEYNMLRLKHLGTPVLEIRDKLTRGAPADTEKSLSLAVKESLMLIKNIFVEAALYNGALGTVTEIGPLLEDGRPTVVFINFDKYLGPRDDIPIPMCPFTQYDSISGRSWTKFNFPLINAFGVTVHKSQGFTLRRACIGLPDENSRDSFYYKLSPSLIYVALSRVPGIGSLALNKAFDPQIMTYQRGKYFAEWNQEEERLKEIAQNMEI